MELLRQLGYPEETLLSLHCGSGELEVSGGGREKKKKGKESQGKEVSPSASFGPSTPPPPLLELIERQTGEAVAGLFLLALTPPGMERRGEGLWVETPRALGKDDFSGGEGGTGSALSFMREIQEGLFATIATLRGGEEWRGEEGLGLLQE